MAICRSQIHIHCYDAKASLTTADITACPASMTVLLSAPLAKQVVSIRSVFVIALWHSGFGFCSRVVHQEAQTTRVWFPGVKVQPREASTVPLYNDLMRC